MDFPYSEKVLKHFKNPQNVGEIDNPDGKATEGSPACGDMVSVQIKVDDKNKKIKDIKFRSYGCASNIATGSIITELAKGKTIKEAKKITWKQASKALGGLPPIKAHCSVLAVEGLRAAIKDYEERKGLIKEKTPTTTEIIEKRLKHVMNPLTGLDIVKTDIVDNIEMKDGHVTIQINLPEDHQFANNIKEEIKEKIEPLWDIKDIKIKFS
ncbi:MAG: iron-sulfur cluster assembly scaffold protein [bacterium]